MNLLIIFNLLLFSSLLSTSHSCPLLTQAFSSVTNFQLPSTTTNCTQIQELNLSSKNLSGTLSWMHLKNISTLRSIDLSHNSLQGSIPGAFWSSPSPLLHLNLAFNRLGGPLYFPSTTTASSTSSLQYLNLSNNRFTSAVGAISSLAKLRSLDLSHNSLTFVPPGLQNLCRLNYLDVSHNSMSGVFPRDFPITVTLEFLNVSFNNLTGKVNSTMAKRFGSSAFINPAHSLSISYSSSLAEKGHKQQHNSSKRVHHKLVIIGVTTSSVVVLGIVLGALWCMVVNRKRKKGTWEEEERRVKEKGEEEEEVSRWVGEARWGAAAVVFEKPLMELTFADLAAATSGFSKEWQLESNDHHDKRESRRNGELYRAVLAGGEMQVVVRVMESVRGVEEKEAEAGFRELAKLRHPNLLPLLGYCIPGREKLVLYEYMEKGDLHQWLHELPSGSPETDDWTADTLWEPHQSTDNRTTTISTMTTTTRDWPTRHRIALGIARGLAFLHQGWAGTRQAIVHGHLVPSNILLDDNLEPRIADFASGSGEETTESNVYSYGLLVMELVTGKGKWTSEEVEKVRKSVKEGKGLEEVDFRMRLGEGSECKWEGEMVECLRVGYLCTAQMAEKRPTMQQVVGLVKDIRPPSATSIASSSTYSSNS